MDINFFEVHCSLLQFKHVQLQITHGASISFKTKQNMPGKPKLDRNKLISTLYCKTQCLSQLGFTIFVGAIEREIEKFMVTYL